MAHSIRQTQQGFSLFEAMISVLLVSILGLGMAYATSQVLLTQRYTATQSLAVVQLREFLQTGETEVSMAGQTLAIDNSPEVGAVRVIVAGVTKDVTLTRSRSLAVTSTELFSGDGKVSLTY